MSSQSNPPTAKRKADNTLTKSGKIAKICSLGLHFSRIASTYQFENDATSYLNWVIRFEAEMDNYNLSSTLTTNHESVNRDLESDDIESQRQKTVYHMILKCVPKEATLVVTRSLPAIQPTHRRSQSASSTPAAATSTRTLRKRH